MTRKWIEIERSILLSSRYLTIMAVIGSLASSVLMVLLGLYDILMEFMQKKKSFMVKLHQTSPKRGKP